MTIDSLDITMERLNLDSPQNAARDIANYWQARLAAACVQMQVDHAALAINDQGLAISVEYAHTQAFHREAGTRYWTLCVAKLFTSALTMLLVSQRKLAFTSLITDLLPGTLNVELLRGISISHLLSHTHGLGCIDLHAAPTNSAGFIDIAAVVSSLQNDGRIFAPGKFFSYGAAGYIVLGCVIEQVTRKPFGVVLHECILAHLAHEKYPAQPVRDLCETAICPSSGKGLNLRLDDLLVFAESFLARGTNAFGLSDNVLAEIFSIRQPLPGWSPVFSGCCLGWKDFGHGWHGHNGIDNEQLMYVRINRTRKTAICLTANSTRRSPGALPSLLFRTAYPALCFSTAMQPRIINEPKPNDYNSIVGHFGRGYLSFHIAVQQDKLLLEVRTTVASHTVVTHRCYLRTAEKNIYFLEKPWQNITFLQLVVDDNTSRYLWDHTQLWPELEMKT